MTTLSSATPFSPLTLNRSLLRPAATPPVSSPLAPPRRLKLQPLNLSRPQAPSWAKKPPELRIETVAQPNNAGNPAPEFRRGKILMTPKYFESPQHLAVAFGQSLQYLAMRAAGFSGPLDPGLTHCLLIGDEPATLLPTGQDRRRALQMIPPESGAHDLWPERYLVFSAVDPILEKSIAQVAEDYAFKRPKLRYTFGRAILSAAIPSRFPVTNHPREKAPAGVSSWTKMHKHGAFCSEYVAQVLENAHRLTPAGKDGTTLFNRRTYAITPMELAGLLAQSRHFRCEGYARYAVAEDSPRLRALRELSENLRNLPYTISGCLHQFEM